MARRHVTYEGSHSLDLTELEGDLVDLKEGGRQGMRTQLEGFQEARDELEHSAEAHREAGGIPKELFEHFLWSTERLERIDEKLALALKQVEVLVESRAYYVDLQQSDIALMVDALRSRALRRRERSLLVPFDKTLRYNGQIGTKGALTKRRLAAEAADGGTRTSKAKGKGAGGKAQTRGGAAKKPAPVTAGPGPTPVTPGPGPTPVTAGSGPAPVTAGPGPAPVTAGPGTGGEQAAEGAGGGGDRR